MRILLLQDTFYDAGKNYLLRMCNGKSRPFYIDLLDNSSVNDDDDNCFYINDDDNCFYI